MARIALVAWSAALLASAPARAGRSGQISVSASVVSSTVVRSAELISVRRQAVPRGTRIVASLRPGGPGPIVVAQPGGPAVQLPASAERDGAVAVVLPDSGAAELVVTVFSDAVPPGRRR